MSLLMKVFGKKFVFFLNDLLTTWTVHVQMLNLYEQMQMILLKTSPLIKLESPATDIPLWPD